MVYLYGLLPDSNDANDDLEQLIVSSGDFGLAYLTERWVSRFISELFRNYVICFIGYSLNDPTLRYMVDALSADKLRGEKINNMFIFASSTEAKQEEKKKWRTKNIEPIIYSSKNKYKHGLLHKTLQEWARCYRDGINGKRDIILKYARKKPEILAKEEIELVIWALSDNSGEVMEYFANSNPVPPLK